MDAGAEAMPVPDRWRLRWRSPGTAASGAANPPELVADEVLLVRVADGDAAALAALYQRYAVRLLGFLGRYTRDAMVAEEILQDTLLAELAAGVLAAPERAAVAAHLADCPSCRAALGGWTAVAASTAAAAGAPPSAPSMVRAVLTQAALDPQPPPVHKRRAGFAGQLLRAEFHLVRPAVWVASVLVMACAVVLAAVGGDDAGGGVLSLVAPLVAVGGVAGVYGPERDPAYEALAATVTSPRLVLLARVTLVFCYDLTLALAASVVVSLVAPRAGLIEMVTAWLGPMTLLLALSLLLAMWIGPNLAIGVAAGLWAVRVLTVSVPELADGWLAAWLQAIWATSPGTIAAALVLVLTAVALSGRPLPTRDGPYRPGVS